MQDQPAEDHPDDQGRQRLIGHLVKGQAGQEGPDQDHQALNRVFGNRVNKGVAGPFRGATPVQDQGQAKGQQGNKD